MGTFSFRKVELLTSDDLELPWRPIYELLEKVQYGPSENQSLNLYPACVLKSYSNFQLFWVVINPLILIGTFSLMRSANQMTGILNFSLRLSSNSETSASELLEYLEEIFCWYYRRSERFCCWKFYNESNSFILTLWIYYLWHFINMQCTFQTWELLFNVKIEILV